MKHTQHISDITQEKEVKKELQEEGKECVALLIPNELTRYISKVESKIGRLISIDISPPINKESETQTHYRIINLYLPASNEQTDKDDRIKIKAKIEKLIQEANEKRKELVILGDLNVIRDPEKDKIWTQEKVQPDRTPGIIIPRRVDHVQPNKEILDEIMDNSVVDMYRDKHPKDGYTFSTQLNEEKYSNSRIDYIFASRKIKELT